MIRLRMKPWVPGREAVPSTNKAKWPERKRRIHNGVLWGPDRAWVSTPSYLVHIADYVVALPGREDRMVKSILVNFDHATLVELYPE